MQARGNDCNHNFVSVNVEIESASETIDVEVCDICCFAKSEIALQKAQTDLAIISKDAVNWVNSSIEKQELINQLRVELQQSQEREQQLQAKNHDLELSIAAVRAANDAWKTIVTELREEIKHLKTVWQ